ncbi:hypothetical protein JL720_7231 [Aureococcus anophagefferens]|nr:hypothetical protein JL720_7231 [Aureococcus anophagefferens]
MVSLPVLAPSRRWRGLLPPPAWASLARVDYDAPPVPNASSLVGLTVCGYQQWFRAPNDTATNEGWTHWGNGVGALHNGTGIEEDYWPDLSEFGDDENGEEANAILDVFDGTAFVAGAGQWWWRSDQPSANWTRAYDRMGSWSPWNAGDWNGDAAHPAAATGYWAADKAAAEQAGVLWQPELAPGMSTNHRDGTPAGSGRLPRLRGAYLWAQFYAAAAIGAKTAFVGMFDELDEGTQILKVVNDPPAPGDIGYEGLPSHCYLVLTGRVEDAAGDAPRNATTPDCAALTQPTAPAARAPAAGVLRWAPPAAGGGAVDHHEVPSTAPSGARPTRRRSPSRPRRRPSASAP